MLTKYNAKYRIIMKMMATLDNTWAPPDVDHLSLYVSGGESKCWKLESLDDIHVNRLFLRFPYLNKYK